ncbi:condensation domain-containing protein, partial [Aquimarina addita]|uniref:condensation domain-containing protein n=1 Tax=Aquimarina addita TaxID=870485 RepID=UPI0031ECE118
MEVFIKKLEDLNLFLTKKNDGLILRGSKGKLNKDEIQKIKENNYIVNFIRDNKKDLIKFLDKKKLLPSFYKLSPLQEGMLFHGLYDEDSKAYVVQLIVDFPKGLNIDYLKSSWDYVLRNHSILRSAFFHKELSIPVQCVYNKITLPFSELDYSSYSLSEQEDKISSFLESDSKKGFVFDEVPLMRVTLIKIGSASYTMILTHHHILLDGWSMSIIIEEFLQAYEVFSKGFAPSERQEDLYEDYIKYIASKDVYLEEKFWKKYLHELEAPSLLPFSEITSSRNKTDGDFAELSLVIDFEFTNRIRNYAQKNHLTVNTLTQGVWAILLSKYTGDENIVYGVTVSGRPVELENSDKKVGLYINTLPLYSRLTGDKFVSEWLLSLQSDHTACRDHQYTYLSKIQTLSGLQGDLFDSIMVFENYPVSKVLSEENDVLEANNITSKEQTNYLLTITISLGKELIIDFSYNSTLLANETIVMIQRHFKTVLDQLIDSQDRKISEIKILTPKEEHQLLKVFNDTQVEYPKDKTVIDLFEEQVKNNPEHIA